MKAWTGVVLMLCACSRGGTPAEPARQPTKADDEQKSGRADKPDHDDAEHRDEPPHEGLPSRVELTSELQKSAGMKMEPVRLERLPPTIELTGEIAANPDLMGTVAARAPGRITEVRVKEGDHVRKGAVLVVMESAELARARAAVTSVAARAQAARTTAERTAKLVTDGLATLQQQTAAEADAAALNAEELAARQVLSAYGASATTDEHASMLELRAPISGIILTRDAVVGENTSPEKTLLSIANLDEAFFVARVFENNLAEVRPGSHADVKLNAFPQDAFNGEVQSVGHRLDPTARTISARILLKNHDEKLRVGLFGKARIVVKKDGAGAEVPTIPMSAVMRIAERDVVFVAQPDGHFEVHPVTTGGTAGGRIVVLAGLRVGELVVTEGAFTLKSMILKGTFAEEEE